MGRLTPTRKALQSLGIYAWRSPPRGTDLFFDLRTQLPRVTYRTVFDVGANIGQSADQFLTAFPKAIIQCFEPVPATFEQLKAKFAQQHRVQVHRVALGAESGTLMMEAEGTSSMNRISKSGALAVEADTIDRFCVAHDIDHIDFLKVDAEGYDLEVLKGAMAMFDRSAIDVVKVEVGMSPHHSVHVRFEDVKSFLEAHSMDLFSIIDQLRNFVPGGPYLQWADAVFISRSVVERHRARSGAKA